MSLSLQTDWTIPLDGVPACRPLATSDLLLLPTHEAAQPPRGSTLYAIDLADGTTQWRFSFTDALISGITLAGESILVTAYSTDPLGREGAVLALDPTGDVRWRWAPGLWTVSAPAVAMEMVYITVDRHTLVTLNLASGEERSRVPLTTTASLSAPALAGDVIYVPCRGPHLLAVQLDRTICWDYTGGEENVWLDKTPLVVDGRVLAVLSSGAVVALHAERGAHLWRVDVGPAGEPLSPPVTDGERLYVGARDGLHALTIEDGAESWHLETPRKIEAGPVVHAGVVYATCHDHHLYALDAASGKELWRYEVDRRIEVPPALAEGGGTPSILVADWGGTVTAIARPLSATEQEAAGNWVEAASAYAELGQLTQAAQLLEAHARSLETAACSPEDRAAAWAAAAQAYETEGEVHQAAVCQEKVARHLGLPVITMDVEVDEGLVLGAWSQLRFIVRNEGYGPARKLFVRTSGDQFKGQVRQTQRIFTLREGGVRSRLLDVCPQAYGDTVPLRVTVEYEDQTGEPRQCAHTIYIPVAREESTRSTGQTINVFVSGSGAAAIGQGAVAAGAHGVAVGEDVQGGITLGQTTPSPGKETDTPSEWNTAIIRKMLEAAFNDMELTTLCFDHFHPVYEDFGTGMGKGAKVQRLLDHCVRHGQIARLLGYVKARNLAQYTRFQDRLRNEVVE